MAQPDPAASVPGDLMPHVHLISSFRYPTMPRLDLNEVSKWLMSAPQIARDRAPFFWTYLDRPGDGTIVLTWQPLQRLGHNFASDGYVWAPPEQVYKHDLGNGLMLEIYVLKSGYVPGEAQAMHARRRFRLVPVPGHPNPPQPDVSLFIVHYGPSEPNDRIPVNMIPYDERINTLMQQRHFLMRAGQIRRKEFMLSDRVNWPSLPELTRQQAGPQSTPRGVPQQMAYPTQITPGPPAKRARHSQGHAQPGGTAVMPAVDGAFDDDEDTSRGDMFDHLTPREISLSRYQQNHEWLEEILSSPYRINQITPADLGIGLKGELASLTEGIFAAQGGEAIHQIPDKTYVGRLDAGQAEEFRKRVNSHLESTKLEIEKMQAEHAKALAEFKQTTLLGKKERELRSVMDGTGSEIWRVENQIDANDDDSTLGQPSKSTIEDIVRQVEDTTGFKIESQPFISQIQAGGYQPPIPQASSPVIDVSNSHEGSQSGSHNSGVLVGASDVEMGGTAAGMLDQIGTGPSSHSTPAQNLPTPYGQQGQSYSNTGTPSHINNSTPPNLTASGTPDPSAATPPTAHTTATTTNAITTQAGGIAAAPNDHRLDPAQNANGADADAAGANDDWVVVPKEEFPRDEQGAPVSLSAADAPKPADSTKVNAASAAATPAGSTSFNQNDFSSLGDLDTGEDVLSGLDAPDMEDPAGDLGDGLDLNMDMDDSAFGDAFHGVDSAETPGDGQSQDM